MGTGRSALTTFLNNITQSKISLFGAVLVTVVFPFMLVMLIIDLMGKLENPYFGAVLYMVLTPLFILGLFLVFLGVFVFKGKREKKLLSHEYLITQLQNPETFRRVKKTAFLVVLLTGVNLFALSLATYSGYHYVESNAFCGKFCHSVMEPEYTVYQKSSHSNVACVACHIGSGAEPFVKSKINGMRQLMGVVTGDYERPIKTPVHNLRSAEYICQSCHQPRAFHGDKLVVDPHYQADETNTLTKNVRVMKIGSGGEKAAAPYGIHWHASPDIKITYRSTDETRSTIPEITVERADGSKTVFRTADAAELLTDKAETRVMDCNDCHNRAGHNYLSLDEALDRGLSNGEIPSDLPFIKAQAEEVLAAEYPTKEEGLKAIETALMSYYEQEHPELLSEAKDKVGAGVQGVQTAWADNVWPRMKISWDTYPNHNGHREDDGYGGGCFRCHDGEHESEEGEVISMDCNACHVILAEEEEEPELLQTLSGE